MESADTETLAPPEPSGTEAGREGPEIDLRQLWKTALQVQGLTDSATEMFAHDKGVDLASRLIGICSGLLEQEDLKLAQCLLYNCTNFKTKKQEQKIFPSAIVNRCFFKTRSATLRANQNYSQEAASYSASGEDGKESGARAFSRDFVAHLHSLDKRIAEAPTEDEGTAVQDLSYFCHTHAASEFREDVRKLSKESKPFEIAARAIARAIAIHRESTGNRESVSQILQAYCASILHRLEFWERLGPAKSARIFDKYLSGPDSDGASLSLKGILGDKDTKAFPHLHYLPMEEFVTLAAEEAQTEGSGFQDLLSRVSSELLLRDRELIRLDTLSHLHSSQVFQVREEEEDMDPVRNRAATRQMMMSYRQVRNQLLDVGIKGNDGRCTFGWYSIPRVMEAYLIGGFRTLTVTGVLPPGTDHDPLDESLTDLKMEYMLAKVEPQYHEPPLTLSLASAWVYLFWEILALGIEPDTIRVAEADEAAGTMTLTFEVPGESEISGSYRLDYTMADIEGTRHREAQFPNETDPIVFEFSEDGLPTAMLFIGESVVKELPAYHRMSFGNRIALYILERRMQKERAAPAPRKVEKKQEARKKEAAPPKKKAPPVLDTPQRIAAALLEQNRSLRVLEQESLSWTPEVIEKIAEGKKVTGKQRRLFRRLHNQLRYLEDRGFSNRLEGQFFSLLSRLSRDFDSEEDH